MTLAERLRELRATAGISSRELAAIAGVSRAYPGLIESSERTRIGTGVAAKLAQALGATTDWLILGTGNAPTPEQIAAAVERARSEKAAKDAPDSTSPGPSSGKDAA